MTHTEYKVSYQNFLESVTAYRRISKGTAFVYYLDVWILPLLGVGAAMIPVIGYLRHDYEMGNSWLGPGIGGLFVAFLAPVMYRLKLRKTYKLRNSLVGKGCVLLEFDDSRVRFIVPGKSEVAYAWPTFTDCVEGDTAVTLLAGRAAFHTIPKSALTDEQWDALRRNMSPKKDKDAN